MTRPKSSNMSEEAAAAAVKEVSEEDQAKAEELKNQANKEFGCAHLHLKHLWYPGCAAKTG